MLLLELEPPEEPPLDGDEDPEEPEDPDEPPGGGGMDEGIEEDDEDWLLAQPPMRSADTEPTSTACTATTSSRLREWLLYIAFSPIIRQFRNHSSSTTQLAVWTAAGAAALCDVTAERALMTRR